MLLGHTWECIMGPLSFLLFLFLLLGCNMHIFALPSACPSPGTKQWSNCHRMKSLKLWARRNLFFFLFCKLTSSAACDRTAHLIRWFPCNAFTVELFWVFSAFRHDRWVVSLSAIRPRRLSEPGGLCESYKWKRNHKEYSLWRVKYDDSKV